MMQTRRLGATALTVTPIGLGLAALGRPAYIDLGRADDLGDDRTVRAMRRRCHRVLDAAFEAGIRYLDAARSYGRAEEFLGSWLGARGLPEGAITVGSKWGYVYTGEWRLDAPVHEVKEHSLATLRRQLEESGSLLGDRLALYQIHSATLESGVLEDGEVLAELDRLRHESLVIGLTVSGPRQGDVIRRAMDAEVDGVNPFQTVQATWNLLERSAGPALAEAHDAGWGVIVKEALANGRLTSHGAATDRQLLERVGAAHGATADQVALAAALAEPWASVVLSGAVSVDQLRSNAGAVSLGLTEDDRRELAKLVNPAEEYWRARAALPWG